MGSSCGRRRTRRRIRSTMPRCIRCSPADGSGCCASTTASPAPGAALTDPIAASLGAAEGAPAWDRLLATLPSVADQFRSARADCCRSSTRRGSRSAARASPDDVGAAAVGRGRDRSAALDRLSADAARHPAAGRYARARRRRDASATRRSPRTSGRRWPSWTRPNSSSRRCTRPWRIRRSSSGSACSISRPPASARPRAASGGRSWRPASCSARIRRSVRNWRPARRSPCQAPQGPARLRARSTHRPRDRAVRHGRSPRSRAARLVSRARLGHPGLVGETGCDARRPRSSSAAHRLFPLGPLQEDQT